jgi:serine/threonine-protein kinase
MVEPNSPAPPTRLDLTGQPLGSYRVLERLGSGGMSTVYRALHAETGAEVALKVLLGTIAQNAHLLQRFLREARSAEKLEHPNIVAIYDRGVDQGRHYLVLEYVAGGDFHDYIQSHGPLDAPEALTVVRGVASGLRYAADRGVIHRDIKPSNILRAPDGVPKIIDLGLALHAEFEDERVTREGTTVGTVDYMAPEQARDSRATSIQSDMYSLGCTFYCLLTGIPPYPGGDITEKLTRHARAPAPDVRDLRSEIPEAVARILLRLMAKEPQDRYATYDELIAALDAAARREPAEAGAIALLPLDEETPAAGPPARVEVRGGRIGGADFASPDAADAEEFAIDSLGGLSLELADERPSTEGQGARSRTDPPMPRLGRATPADSVEPRADETPEELPRARPDRSLVPWFVATSAVAGLAVVLVIGLHLMLNGPRAADVAHEVTPNPDRENQPLGALRAKSTTPPVDTAKPPRPDAGASGARTSQEGRRADAREDEWREPVDDDPIPGDVAARSPLPEALRARLPEWARTPAQLPETRQIVVRRVPGPDDGPSIATTLLQALDNSEFGTVEVADQGPLVAEDLRTSGETKVVRARYGFRPIVRIGRPPKRPAPEQEAFLPLRSKTLVLEGIDLIFDVRDLPGRERALFGCRGADLTLRDCTITVLNPGGLPFTLIRQGPVAPSEAARRPSRIRLERTLVRGDVFALAELGGGPVELVLDDSTILAGGAGPPLVTASHPDAKADQRVIVVGTLIACPGPLIRREPATAGAKSGRLMIRAYGSEIGRLQGPGIASVVAAPDDQAMAAREIDWAGDANVFAGWKGFFAHGKGATITVDGLAEVRSTWNAAEQGSRVVPLGWSLGGEMARVPPAALTAKSLPGLESRLIRAAVPGPGLFPKAIDSYPSPQIPEPSTWAIAPRGLAVTPGAVSEKVGAYDPRAARQAGRGAGGPARVPVTNPSASTLPLEMRTGDASFNGDLGAFLRSQVSRSSSHARVLVLGTGTHRFTPVSLPDGLTVEIQVVPEPANADPPSWTAEPQAEGRALIELHRGALVLSRLNLRHDPASRLQSLIAVEDAHLVLDRCQLTVPPNTAASGDLIQFRAATTRPMTDRPGKDVFAAPFDRPVCRLIDTILIASGSAVRAQVARGQIALTNCAIAGDEAAVALEPASKIARRAFFADLWLDRCTLVSGRSIVRLGRWPGSLPGPVRPWLIQTRHCAFFARTEAPPRDAMLMRVDADAYAGGCVFWQAGGDAFELDDVIGAQDVPPGTATPREGTLHRWERFWGSNHATAALSGPRSLAGRFGEWPRPGRIEPADLVLQRVVQGQRAQPEVGADLSVVGIGPRPTRPGPRRN